MFAALLLIFSLSAAPAPGAIDRHVTQANIQTTICVKGYASKVRPPVSFTGPLKAKLVGYGYLSAWQLDHMISLELGGAPRDLKNLWIEPIAQAHVKDREENRLHKAVCDGSVSLRSAQRQIVATAMRLLAGG